MSLWVHCGWLIENTIDELKTHLLGRKTPIRSLKPRQVVQEIYGWLLSHWAVRWQDDSKLPSRWASQRERLGNTCTLKVLRRAVPMFQDVEPDLLPFFGHG